MQSPLKNLAFALEKYPERVEIVPIQELVTDSARKNDKRPAFVKLSVPDEVVKQLRGRPEDTDLVLLVRVPKEVLQRPGSLIVLPGEVR
ncbi:MAG TPA: hypothetical protein VNW71_23690 [Thermoanaerobaculia bacterium]|nr:hypothetical protein [Thermoanaerobaculia bacterium]